MTTMTVPAEITADHPGRIVVETPYRLKDKIKAIPGAKWNTDAKVWTVPQSWTACLALRSEFGSALSLGPALRDWASGVALGKKILTGIRGAVDGVQLPALPGLDGEWIESLYPHQVADAVFAAEAKHALIMNGTGTGKTRSALAALKVIEAKGGEPFPAVIAAPLSMLRTWEIEILDCFPDATVSIATGTPAKTRKALEPGADFYIICWDSLRRYSRLAAFSSVKLTDSEKQDHELNHLGLRTFIGDEIHRTKQPKSKRTRAAWYLAHQCQYRIGLTGTPMQDTPMDLYGMLHLIDPVEYPTKTAFMERYLNYSWNTWGGIDIDGLRDDRVDEWEQNFNTRTRRVTKEMVLDFLPPKIEAIRWVDLPPKHRKMYDELSKTYVTQLSDSSVLTVENQLVLAGRLVQIANATGEIETYEVERDGETIVKEKFVMSDESPKIDAFLSDYEDGDFDGESVVVFSDSYQLLARLAEKLVKKEIPYVEISGKVTGEDRTLAMKAFQAGEVPICLLTRAGGEGITLTTASTMVRLARSWSLTVHQQVEDRVHRIGSEQHEFIRYVDYITANTIEVGQFDRLADKESRTGEVLKDGELLAMLSGK